MRFIVIILLFVVAGCATTGTHFAVTSDTDNGGKANKNITLREKIANIGSVRFLYASHPVEYLNLGKDTTSILTDTYWFPNVNKELHKICESTGGKTIAKNEIIDSFTGKRTLQTVEAGYKTGVWKCVEGSLPFSVKTIITRAKSKAQVGYMHKKLFVNVISNESGKPVLTKNQLKAIGNAKDKPLADFLNSKFGLLFGKATSKIRVQSDGAYYQQYMQNHGKVTDISKDMGVIYDLNAYCAYNGGHLSFVDNFALSKITRSLIPDNVIMQCDSAKRPFYVKFGQGRTFRNKYGEMKTAYTILAKEGLLDKSKLLPGHYIQPKSHLKNKDRSVKEFIKNNFEVTQ